MLHVIVYTQISTFAIGRWMLRLDHNAYIYIYTFERLLAYIYIYIYNTVDGR